MPLPIELPWPRILAALRQRDYVRLSRLELRLAGHEADALVETGLFEHAGALAYEPEGCDRSCSVTIRPPEAGDEDVLIACPRMPSCWRGWRRVPRESFELFIADAACVFPMLGRHNGFAGIESPLPSPFVPIGQTEARGRQCAVVWVRAPGPSIVETSIGLRHRLGVDAVIVVTSAIPEVRIDPAGGVAFQRLNDDTGRIPLHEALDFLVPAHRDEVALGSGTPDYVEVRFRHAPNEGHLLLLNGAPLKAARQSDKVFLQFLLLAATRAFSRGDGWRAKDALIDNRAIDELRRGLNEHDDGRLRPGERTAILETAKGTGRVRLAVPKNQIVFEPSLSSFDFMLTKVATPRDGKLPKLSQRQAQSLERCVELIRECKSLGVSIHDPTPTSPVTSTGGSTARQRRA
jgi:hypothetical protein